ncbi:hypothetical protein AAVH_34232 [Aphelenchoides avenae]|nr:hypothetical protein AAVH_34232 [Aphelenchus avenae]
MQVRQNVTQEKYEVTPEIICDRDLGLPSSLAPKHRSSRPAPVAPPEDIGSSVIGGGGGGYWNIRGCRE